jgi:hypothetical protein
LEFNVNSPFLYAIAAAVILFVLAQSIFFLVRAYRRGKELGMDAKKLRKVIFSTSIFTIAPAISILLGVVSLSKFLGIPFPWIRMSVIGALTYEVPAAKSAADALGILLENTITDPKVFTTVAWVMTLGSIMPLILTPIFLKKIQSKVGKAVSSNKAWADVMSAAAFIGLIAAFVAKAIAGQGEKSVVGDGAGILSVCALLFSVILMLVLTKVTALPHMKWLESFAMPCSMIGAMLLVMLLAQVLPADIAFLEWRG